VPVILASVESHGQLAPCLGSAEPIARNFNKLSGWPHAVRLVGAGADQAITSAIEGQIEAARTDDQAGKSADQTSA
jgi:hypothetical protein